jgi:chromosomal replication initiator protein
VQPAEQQNLGTLWNQALASLRSKLDREDFDNWIEPLAPVSIDDANVELSVPNRLFAAWVEENYLDALAAAWVEAFGRKTTFTFTWDNTSLQGELFKDMGVRDAPRVLEPGARQKRNAPIERYVFDSFVVGSANQFAHAASVAVSNTPGTLYNPFFIYGGVGLGKTHLVNAIGNATLAADPSRRVLALSADSFTDQLIEAIARNKTPAFKARMRRIDVLIIDDIQFLAGRERTQEEIFHLFNALYDSGRQIIVTSDKFPNELQGVEERLCSRFGWGLVADIQAPDLETRTAILERKAHDEGIELPLDVAALIASKIESNIRDLEGALTRVCAYASLNNRSITAELAEELLANVAANAPRHATLDEIENGVALHFGLKKGELSARRRTKKVAEARQVAMFIMRNHAGASYPMIGRQLGGRDHSTVIHACRNVDRRTRDDVGFRRMLEAVSKNLGYV